MVRPLSSKRKRGPIPLKKKKMTKGRRRAFAISSILIMIIASVAIYFLIIPGWNDQSNEGVGDSEEELMEGSDEANLRAELDVNLTFLDDTQISKGTYQMDIRGSEDLGVLLIENTGWLNDSYNLELMGITHEWDASFETQSIDVLSGDVETCVIQISLGEGGISHARIRATSVTDPDVFDEITLELVIRDPNGVVAVKGDQLMVEYYLTDPDGHYLDDGTLPAIAGEPEAGPAGELTYIEGFYMGLLGMGQSSGIFGLWQDGETKTIRVPPQLGYGNSEGHELQETTLIFTLTIKASER